MADGKSYGNKFFNLEDDFAMEGTSEAKGSGAIVNKPTKREITINNNNIPVNLSNIIWSAILTIPIGPANWFVSVLSLNDLIKNEKDW